MGGCPHGVVVSHCLDDRSRDQPGVGQEVVQEGCGSRGEGAIAVRQHVVQLRASKPDAMDNVVPGTVVRQVFLGSGRDYLVEMPDRTQLRVVASAAENIPQGAAVWLHLPPESCRVLSG